MIFSMTGFAAMNSEVSGGILSLELRAVNHRYLDIQMRLPEELRAAEPTLRALIANHVSRGKVECKIGFNPSNGGSTTLELDHAYLQQLIAMASLLQQQQPTLNYLSVGELMRWPGVLKTNTFAPTALQTLCIERLTTLLSDFNASRQREGEKLKTLLRQRCESITTQIASIQPKLPLILESYINKLSTRLQEALTHIDDDRLKQEFALFAQKIDIDEELSRLGTHLVEVRRILDQGGQVGKRLDFLMQELNREANTLGAKSVSAETTQASVELKVLIEQMREQIQNIE